MLSQLWHLLTTYPAKPIPLDLLEDAARFIEHYTVRQVYLLLLWLTQTMTKLFLTTPHSFLNTTEFKIGYAMLTRLSLVLIVFMAAYTAVQKIRGKLTDDQLLSTAKVALVWPVWVIFAPPVLGFCFKKFSEVAKLLINLENMFVPDFMSIGAVLGLLIFMCAFIFYLFKLMLYYGKRFIKLLVLSLCAPVVFGLYCFPTHQHVIRVWIEQLLTLLATQVVHALVLLIVSWVTIGVGSIPGIYGPIKLILQVCGLIYMGEVERDVTQYIHSTQGHVSDAGLVKRKLSAEKQKVVRKLQADAAEKGKDIAKKVIKRLRR